MLSNWINIFSFFSTLLFTHISLFGLSHEERLVFFKKRGFKPKVIYDIGAYHGEWTKNISAIFPKSRFYMFEANIKHQSNLEKIGHPYFIGVLGNENKLTKFYSIDGTGDSLLREQTFLYEKGRCREETVMMSTLQKVIEEHSIPRPDLVKLDVQGAEKMIIEGGLNIITNAEMIILETKILPYNQDVPLATEIMTYMDQIGYNLLDIAELHYFGQGNKRELFEVDFIFVKKTSPFFRRGILIKEG